MIEASAYDYMLLSVEVIIRYDVIKRPTGDAICIDTL